jgi:hypothetical protein
MITMILAANGVERNEDPLLKFTPNKPTKMDLRC